MSLAWNLFVVSEDTKVLQRKPQGGKHTHKKIVTTNLVRHLNHLHPVEYGHVKEANTGQVSCLNISKAVMRKIIEITGKANMGVCPDKIDFCLYMLSVNFFLENQNWQKSVLVGKNCNQK